MKTLILALFLVPWMAQADISVPRAKQYAYTVFDASANGGNNGLSAGSVSTGLTLQAGTVVTNAWVYIQTQFAASGSESFGVSCVGSQDIVAYQPVKNLAPNSIFGGQPVSTLSNTSAVIPTLGYASALVPSGSVPSACNVVVNVRGGAASGYTPYTAGKATLILEYFRLNLP